MTDDEYHFTNSQEDGYDDQINSQGNEYEEWSANSPGDGSNEQGSSQKSQTPILIIDEEEEEEGGGEINEKLANYDQCLLKFKNLVQEINIVRSPNGSIQFSIPSHLLPLTIRTAYGFNNCENLFDINLYLDDYDWTLSPFVCTITNPLSNDYYGKSLVTDVKMNFFKGTFRPKSKYRSAPLILRAQYNEDKAVMQKLQEIGYTYHQALRAATLCKNDIEKSVTFLQTGQYNEEEPFSILLGYHDCPLLYFILEILDAILDLQDHCAMCGKPTTQGLKPGTCNAEKCLYRFITINVGVSVVMEIKRDKFVADLLFSVFSVASQYADLFNPKPPQNGSINYAKIVDEMPSMSKIIQCMDDFGLLQCIGKQKMDILKWVVLTCRSNFLLLPPELEFPQFRSGNSNKKCFQFMALTASPEQENIFQQMKKKYGSRFLWHGSSIDRWHAIIRQGLKNMTGTHYQQNGKAHGPGIYFAHNSGTSLSYATPGKNLYSKSELDKNLRIVALCEVINLPLNTKTNFVANGLNGEKITLNGSLNDHGWCMTLTMNEASIVRFVFVNLSADVNVTSTPIRNIPTLDQVLRKRANLNIKK